MNRKWIFAVVSVLAVALAMFPLNLLWVGQSPLHAAVSSLLFGLPALLTAWTPKGRCAGGRAESRRAAGNTGFRIRTGRPDRILPEDCAVLPDHTVPADRTEPVDRTEPAGRKSLLAKVALGIAFFRAGGYAGIRYFDRRRRRRSYEGSRIRPVDTACCRWA